MQILSLLVDWEFDIRGKVVISFTKNGRDVLFEGSILSPAST